jgi:heptose I phosphotransferase
MHPLIASFPYLAGCLLALGLLLGARAWRRDNRRRRRGFVVYRPAWRAFLRRAGLTEPEHFLDWPAVIISGHPDRNVAHVLLGDGPGAVAAYLKRELRVSWSVRLRNFLAGFGLVSHSLRETQSLDALAREGLPGPDWLAAGADEKGRAFLLVRAVAGRDLPTLLRHAPRQERAQLARKLGAALAGLHEAGFEHRDLYAKHVLVAAGTGDVHFVDWARARRYYSVGVRARARDLAALHTTLREELAGPRERLLCLLTYWAAWTSARKPPWRALWLAVERRTRRLLAHRHVREKRAEALPEPQAWTCLDGEALCVTPALTDLCAQGDVDWLALDRQPAPTGPGPSRRWLPLPDGRVVLLVRRRARPPLANLFARWRGGMVSGPLTSRESQDATLLLRLERHAVPAPRVLAMGHRQEGAGQMGSFLLTEPIRDTIRLEAWLARQDRAEPGRVQDVLARAGALVHRLHEASCYLRGAAGTALALRCGGAGERPEPVLGEPDGVFAARTRLPRCARRDVAHFLRFLSSAGCGTADLRFFLQGYQFAGAGPSPPEGAPRERVAAGASSRPNVPPIDGGRTVTFTPFWQRLLRGALRLRQRPDWADFVGPDWANRIMAVEVTDRFHAKQGRSTGRWVLYAPQRGDEGAPPRRLTVYLKRHYELPRWHGLLAALWPNGDWSPAFQEWNHLEWARRQGVPVPEVVAAGEITAPGGKLQSFLAVKELTDMLPLHEAIPLAASRLPPLQLRRWKRGLVAEMARLARMLHDRRCFHKDLYLCHFYIHRDDTSGLPDGAEWRGRVYLIDLHRLAHHPWSWRLWQLKDLAALLYSSEMVGIDARDQVWFWRFYRGIGQRRRSDRWLRRCVLFKWRRYRQHNLRRKARRSKDGPP